MSILKPYPKIYRNGPPFTLDPFFEDRKSKSGLNNLASYELLKNDLKLIFEFIEPCPENQAIFSHKIYELLLRACTEVESLCKQIFEANNKTAKNIIRFSDLESAMKLSSYSVNSYGFSYPEFYPFEKFKSTVPRDNRSPVWYKAYNNVKHNRLENFSDASLKNVIEAVGGVYVLLVASYGLGFDHNLKMSYHHHHMEDTPTFFRAIKLPIWEEPENYDYVWENLKTETEKFQFHPLEEII